MGGGLTLQYAGDGTTTETAQKVTSGAAAAESQDPRLGSLKISYICAHVHSWCVCVCAHMCVAIPKSFPYFFILLIFISSINEQEMKAKDLFFRFESSAY